MGRRKSVAEAIIQTAGVPTGTAGDGAAGVADDPNADLIAWLVEKLGLPREEVLSEIEELAAKYPVFRMQLGNLRLFMEKAFDMVAGNTAEGFREVIALFQSGSGPVDNQTGDTA